MKRILFTLMSLLSLNLVAMADPEVKFETLTYNFGTFKKADGVQKCTFKFTNTGDKPLVIQRAVASCGCTVPTFTKAPIKPGESGVITVEYNGARFLAGHFKKSITVNTNGKPEMVRLYIEGDMTDDTENK